MNINLVYYSIILINILKISLINSSSCSIFLSLNCSCFQSNADLTLSSPIKLYSHLYCLGNDLNKKTFQSPFGLDFPNQNRFRTISIELNFKKSIEISSNQFDSLSLLFSQTDFNAKIEISIRLIGFRKIVFNQYSLTSNIFSLKHLNTHLSLYLIPKIFTNSIQKDFGEDNSIDLINQFKFNSNCFSGLKVSSLNLYIQTLKDDFSLSYPFELIFNHTNIGQLHFHDSIILPGSSSLKKSFKGQIRSLTLHRRVDIIDSSTYPYYNTVYSYHIHSLEGHSIDLNSFIPFYTNLRGIELIRPRFEVSIDKFIPSLDSLSIDIEYLNEKTLLSARHILNLKLGSHLRRINPRVLNSYLNRLQNFDLSQIILSEMTSDSRCYLIDFIYQNLNKQININLPKIEYSIECNCYELFLNDIQLNKQLKNDILCSKQCRFTDCSIISEYYRRKYPLYNNNDQQIDILNDNNQELPSIDLFSDRSDIDMMTFLINQTNNNQYQRESIRTPSTINTNSDSRTAEKLSKRKKTFFSNPVFVGVIIVLLLIVLLSIILFYIIRYKKQRHFKPVPVYL